MKTIALLIAILLPAPGFAFTELPDGAIALNTVNRGSIVSVEPGRSTTRVELELYVAGCANDLGPITYTAKRAGKRATLAVTAIDIYNEASLRIRCRPPGLLRSTVIEIEGRYTMRQLRLELLADSRSP
jgi:hypothetical protein